MSKLFAFNWKTNPQTLSDAINLLDEYAEILSTTPEPVIVLPPTAFLSDLFEFAEDVEIQSIAFGAQDISGYDGGAFTSQNSAKMVESVGAQYALIGHSETRENLGVTDELCGKKVQRAVEADITPILCVGHGMGQEPDANLLSKQLCDALLPIESVENPVSVIIAYEPVWVIGTGKTASVDHINQISDLIRSILSEKLPMLSNTATILYGGSVTSATISELSQATVDGFLVGGASLKAQEVRSLLLTA